LFKNLVLELLETPWELIRGSWRRLEGSWRHLGALLAALGVLLERPKEPDPPKTSPRRARGELKERSGNGPGRGRGGVFNPLPLG